MIAFIQIGDFDIYILVLRAILDKLIQVRSEISNDHVDFIKNLIFQLVPSFSAVQNLKRKIDIAKGQILLVV